MGGPDNNNLGKGLNQSYQRAGYNEMGTGPNNRDALHIGSQGYPKEIGLLSYLEMPQSRNKSADGDR